MNELDLHKFIKDEAIEYHWHDDDVIIFVAHDQIKELMDVLGHRYLIDGETKCTIKHGYICLWMKDICGDFDIDMKRIF